MSTKALVIAVAGVGCVAAAGAGGYLLALRANSDAQAAERAVISAAAEPAPPAASKAPAVTHAATAAAPARSASKNTRPVESQAPPVAPVRRSLPPVESTRADAPPAMTSIPVTTEPPVLDPISLPPPVTEPPPPPPAPDPRFEELTVKEESVIGIRLDEAVSSETARVEDKVTARVTRDVTVDGRVAIPSGTKLEGMVTSVERGGKFKNPGRLGIRFTTLVLADNTKVAITTEPFSRTAESPGNEATSKIGASAVVGGLLGALIGGKKGAAIGAGAGAAGGTAAVAAGSANNIVLPARAEMTVKLTAPVTLVIERDQSH